MLTCGIYMMYMYLRLHIEYLFVEVMKYIPVDSTDIRYTYIDSTYNVGTCTCRFSVLVRYM